MTQDVGTVATAGSATYEHNIFTVAGSGADVWGTRDEFRFVYQQLTGDGSIVAQVNTVDNVNAWTKAGVMMRETLSANARHAFMLVSPGKGLAFQRRTSTGGNSVHTSGGSGVAPYHLKLTRAGTTITASKSLDGVTWTTVGTQTMTMAPTIYVGLAVTSHADGMLASATFAATAVTATPVSPPPADDSASVGTGPLTALRVLHWNTRHGGTGTDGKYNPERLVNWIVAMTPDIISLNEVATQSKVDAIRSRLVAKTGRTWNTMWDNRGNLVMTHLPTNNTSVCVVNSSVGRKSSHLSTLVNGRTLNIWSAHLATDSAQTRLAEVKAQQGCALNWAEARVVAGDFNATSGRTEIQQMASTYTDAWVAAKALGTAENYSGNCDGCTHNYRIDYIFSSKTATFLTVKSAAVVDTRDANGVKPSDHKPLLVEYIVN